MHKEKELFEQQKSGSNYLNIKELFENFEPQQEDFESISVSRYHENESCELAYEPSDGVSVTFLILFNI